MTHLDDRILGVMMSSGADKMTSAEKKKRARQFYVPMKRLSAEIKPENTDFIMKAKLLLFEMNPEGAYMFANAKAAIGEPVSVVIQTDKPIYLKGKISHCHQILVSPKVIHVENYDFRLGITFNITDPAAKAELERFYRSVAGKTMAA